MNTKPIVLVTSGSGYSAIRRTLNCQGAQVLTPTHYGEHESMYHDATHVLLPGGEDIHPHYYGQRPTFAWSPFPSERDQIEFELATWCLAERKPLMGICRGHQMIAVAAGGTLHQDIRACTGVAHRYGKSHLIRTSQRSRLFRLLGKCYQVNSMHHQAVDRVPEGWTVAARSGSGLIEAIEHPTLPVISVQWHPELMMPTTTAAALFWTFLKFSCEGASHAHAQS